MTDTFLSREEIQALTDKQKRPSQAKVLKAMGIEHRRRPDGTIAILREHITKIFDGGAASAVKSQPKSSGPNWDAMN